MTLVDFWDSVAELDKKYDSITNSNFADKDRQLPPLPVPVRERMDSPPAFLPARVTPPRVSGQNSGEGVRVDCATSWRHGSIRDTSLIAACCYRPPSVSHRGQPRNVLGTRTTIDWTTLSTG